MTSPKKYYRRAAKSSHRRYRGTRKRGLYDAPRLEPQLKQTFAMIGVPDPAPFRPDPFQLEALDNIKKYDVLVSAPTGSGKTWIASRAISEYLALGKKTWYASPLKALSNSIYLQFCQEFGREQCGILTGDRKENPDAPIVVGTTEILRNQLYDAMHEGADIQADLVILDEAHYLSDPDRGVVWEEVLIYLPARVRLLLLSATISNVEEIGEWLVANRGGHARIVRSSERPVPLEMLFLFPDGLISPLGGRKELLPRVRKLVAGNSGRGKRYGSGKLNFGDIMHCLRTFDLLPAIFFLKSRFDCDNALESCRSTSRSPEERDLIERDLKAFLAKFPHLEGHRQVKPLLEASVGSHHAGQLPYWKVLVENFMNQGYLDAIFSTSTVAAGVNFPARTVVLVQSDRYNGHEFADLTATDLHQMTGRAGRRGKDNIGFALVIPGIHQDPQLIFDLKDSPPEPVMSQIHINFSMTLNLLLSHTPKEIKVLLDHSFASFQEKKSGDLVRKTWAQRLEMLKEVLPEALCGAKDPYEIMEYIQKRAEWQRDLRRLVKDLRRKEIVETYRTFLTRGRLFLHKNKNIYVVFDTYKDNERLICLAQNILKRVRIRKNSLNLKKVAFSQIKALFDHKVDVPQDVSRDLLEGILSRIPVEELNILNLKIPEEVIGTEALNKLKTKLNALPCQNCDHFKVCHSGKSKDLKKVLREFRVLADTMEGMDQGLWFSFKKHLRFLKDTGFVDQRDRLTPDGIWASKLRLDQPLLIAEAIRKGAFSETSPEMLAGCIAPFVWDRDQNLDFKMESPFDLSTLENAFYDVLDSIDEIARMKAARGFDRPQILYWPAVALYLWVRGVPWESLLAVIPVNEGDMASLIMRTADHLRQVANMAESHPVLASTAESGIGLIMRLPVFIE